MHSRNIDDDPSGAVAVFLLLGAVFVGGVIVGAALL